MLLGVMLAIVGRGQGGVDWAGGLSGRVEARGLTSIDERAGAWARGRAWAGVPVGCRVERRQRFIRSAQNIGSAAGG